jgi:hypothetical protein
MRRILKENEKFLIEEEDRGALRGNEVRDGNGIAYPVP